jgi:putative membrane protein
MVLPLVAAAVLYPALVVVCRRRRPWPWSRLLLWWAGLALCLVAVTGPLAERAEHSLPAHMVGHVLLGMAGPLLLALAAPVTLALRALPAGAARKLVRLLGSQPLRLLAHPVTAATMNLGGLWVLYTTAALAHLHHHPGLHVVVHAHVLVWGYLFTAAVVGLDPDPHRPSRRYRAVVLTAFLAGHSILAKYLYGHPPPGVGTVDGERAAMVMYYGGDLADVALLVLFCHSWYVAARPRPVSRRSPEASGPLGGPAREPA